MIPNFKPGDGFLQLKEPIQITQPPINKPRTILDLMLEDKEYLHV